MIRIFRKGMITKHFIPYLSQAKRGYTSKVPLWEIVNAIVYKFKTGVQWALLPCKSLISSNKVKYGAIYHHYRKWAKDGSWQRAWAALLRHHKHLLDLSLATLDGTAATVAHTPVKSGGQQVGYQRRKKARTSNTIWITDRQGKVVGFLPPVSGNHNDLFKLEQALEQQITDWKKSGITVDGWFLNADAGFDSKGFRGTCSKHGIQLNAPINPRNTSDLVDYDYYFDEQRTPRGCTKNDML
ncbi:transposase [Tunicatimonas pelagia]|uniref:transposase n=1 Tax=Tunicatimonas pelagia TaxID=931531 RepID=UPI002666973D|nr:transposase [Tunicatimonas pelagia]WKN44230.1 transposase [Tunicatimonas pelagia]